MISLIHLLAIGSFLLALIALFMWQRSESAGDMFVCTIPNANGMVTVLTCESGLGRVRFGWDRVSWEFQNYIGPMNRPLQMGWMHQASPGAPLFYASEGGTSWWNHHDCGCRTRAIWFPWTTFAVVTGFWPLGWLDVRLRLRRRAARAKAGQCAQCGYDLRATPDRCPECGAMPIRKTGMTKTMPIAERHA
jgi:hypothetical protein